MENILLPLDDPRRTSFIKRRNELERKLDAIVPSSRQMDIICPLEILRALLRNGRVDVSEMRANLITKYDTYRKSFSEEEFLKAFTQIATEVGVPATVQVTPSVAVA